MRTIISITYTIFFIFSFQAASFAEQIDNKSINQIQPQYREKQIHPGDTNKLQGYCEVKLVDNKLYVSAENAPIRDLLKNIADKTNIQFNIGKDIQGNITTTVEGLPIEAAIKRLCHNLSVVYDYDPITKTYSIKSIGVYASGKKGLSSHKTPLAAHQYKQNIHSTIQKMKANLRDKNRTDYQKNFHVLRAILPEFLFSECLINEIKNRDNSYEFRWLMADFLSLFPISKETDRDLHFVLEQLTPLVKDESDNPILRKKVIAVLTSCYSDLPKTGDVKMAVLSSNYYELFEELTSSASTHPLVFGKALSGGFRVCEHEEDDKKRDVFKKRALAVLRNYTNHDTFVVRQSMIVLAREKDASGIDETIDILYNTGDKNVFLSAAFSLALLGGDGIIKPLVENNTRFPTTHLCARALKDNKRHIIDIVTGKVQASDDTVRHAIIALGLIKGEKAKSAVKERINDSNTEIGRTAREVLNTL
jgi:hypothetical protein